MKSNFIKSIIKDFTHDYKRFFMFVNHKRFEEKSMKLHGDLLIVFLTDKL